MGRMLLAEWVKTKRTPVRWLVLAGPAVYPLLLIGYFALRPWSDSLQLTVFDAFFKVWTIMFIPVAAGLLAGFLVHQEELCGSFSGLLGRGLPRYIAYLGKLAALMLLTTAATVLASIVVLAGFSLLLHINLPLPVYLAATLLTVLATFPLLALQLWASFAWGMGASIGIGGAGLLIAALMDSVLGDHIWKFVPWAWPARLTGLTGTYLDSDYGSSSVQMLQGLLSAFIFFVAMLAGGLLWFQRWEGRKSYD